MTIFLKNDLTYDKGVIVNLGAQQSYHPLPIRKKDEKMQNFEVLKKFPNRIGDGQV